MALTLPRVSFMHHVKRFDNAEEGTEGIPFAAYVLFDMTAAERTRCQDVLNRDEDGEKLEMVELIHLGRSSLDEAFRHHGDMMANAQHISDLPYQYSQMVCLESTNWMERGALLVNFEADSDESDEDEEEGDDDDGSDQNEADAGNIQTHYFYCSPNKVAITLTNLSIENASWEEMKEYSEVHGALQQEPQAAQTQDPNDPDRARRIEASRQGKGFPIYPEVPPTYGCWVAAYHTNDIDATQLRDKLDGYWELKHPDEYTARTTQLPLSSESSLESTIHAASSQHETTSQSPSFYKDFYIVAASRNFVRDGVIIVHEPGQDPAKRQTRRNEAFQAVNELRFIAEGERPFFFAHNSFALFALHGLPWPYIELGEYMSGKKASFQGKFVTPPTWEPNAPGSQPSSHQLIYDWNKVGQYFRVTCRQNRFNEAMDKYYFIVADQEDVKQQGVLLAKMNWDPSSIEGQDEEQVKQAWSDDMLSSITVERCQRPRDAFKKLKQYAAGELVWRGSAID